MVLPTKEKKRKKNKKKTWNALMKKRTHNCSRAATGLRKTRSY